MGWSAQFPQDEGLIYLNHAAVAPWPLCTSEAVTEFAQENTRRGAQYYPRWLDRECSLRKLLKELINAPHSSDIALTKNTSEALSMIAHGLSWKPGDNVVISNQEFPSNRIVWESLRNLGVSVKVADLASHSSPEDALIAAMDNRTRLMSISSVQYASGLRLDCVKLGQACKDKGVLFCIDAIQSIGAHCFDVQSYQADFTVADGHKWMLGAEGLALFYSTPQARDQLKLNQYGWHMVKHRGDYDRLEWEVTESAQRFECGSPNMLGIHALHASTKLLTDIGMKQVEHTLENKISGLAEKLQQINGLTLLTPIQPERRAGIVTFKLAGQDHHQLQQKLANQGVICAHRGGGIRFSPHFYTEPDKIARAVSLLLENV